MKISKKQIGIIAVALVVVAGIALPNLTQAKSKTVVDKTVIAEVRDLKQQLKIDGVVTLSDSAKVYTQNSGVIKTKFVEKGDLVKEGQVLIQLDTSDLEQQLAQAQYTLSVDQDSLNDVKRNGNATEQAAYDKSKASYDRAKSDYESNVKLLSSGAISSVELDQYKSKMEAAYSEMLSSGEKLKSNNVQDEANKLNEKIKMDQLSVKNLKADIANATIKATATGTLITFVEDNTALINGGSLVAEIADLSKLEVEAKISEYEISKVKIGQVVAVTTLGNTEAVYTGKVKSIDSTGTNQNDEVLVDTIISLDQVDGNIKPNFTVSLIVDIAAKEKALSLPYEALDKNEQGEDVVTVMQGETKKEILVQRGLETDLYVEVISNQLKAGDVVVIPSEKASAKEKEMQAGPGADNNNL